MSLPFVIDNITHRLSDTLKGLLDQSAGRPLDIATAYFSISGYGSSRTGCTISGLSAYSSAPNRRREPKSA